MEEPDEQDRVAKIAVEAFVEGATLVWRPDQSGDGPRHDFAVRVPGSPPAALEATRSRDEDLAEQREALEEHGWRIEADGLASSWWLFLDPDAHVATLHGQVVELLAELEREDVDAFGVNTPGAIFSVGPLRELGVASGRAIETKGRNTVELTHGPGGGRIAGSVATDAAEREAWKKDNREKLAETGLDKTHLFVLLHPGEGARGVMNRRPPPDGEPDLPPEIAHLWAAGKVFNEQRYVVWRGSRDEPWAQLGEVEA